MGYWGGAGDEETIKYYAVMSTEDKFFVSVHLCNQFL